MAVTGAEGAEPLEAALPAGAVWPVGGRDAFPMGDDTALPEKGCCQVDVAPQYASMPHLCTAGSAAGGQRMNLAVTPGWGLRQET